MEKPNIEGRGMLEMPNVPPPQDFSDFGHAHRHTRMTRVGLLHRVHGERTDDVYNVTALDFVLV